MRVKKNTINGIDFETYRQLSESINNQYMESMARLRIDIESYMDTPPQNKESPQTIVE
jgi:hypothetical protein